MNSPWTALHLDDGAWYHGSPERLEVLLVGSAVTRSRTVAEAFSHKPTCLGLSVAEKDGEPTRLWICQNGTRHGYLYAVDEPVTNADVHPHPNSAFQEDGDFEWLIDRPLRVRLIAEVPVGEKPDCGNCARRPNPEPAAGAP